MAIEMSSSYATALFCIFSISALMIGTGNAIFMFRYMARHKSSIGNTPPSYFRYQTNASNAWKKELYSLRYDKKDFDNISVWITKIGVITLICSFILIVTTLKIT